MLNKNFFTKDISILLSLRLTRPIVEVFTSAFLISYLLKVANEDIRPIALYFLFFSISVAFFFVLFGNFVKRKNKMILFRLGLVVNFLHIFLIIMLKEKAINYIIYLGISYGFYATLYALPYNSIISEKVNKSKMGKFLGYLGSFNNITKIFASFLLGKYIHTYSFEKTAIIILIITLVEIVISFFIKSEKTSREKFHLIDFYKEIKDNSIIKKAFIIELLKGVTIYGCLNLLITLYIITKFENNLNLGIFNSIFALITIIISYIFGKYLLSSQYRTLSIINTVFIIITVFLFAFFDNKISFILYNICYASFIQILQLITEVNMFNISNSRSIENKYRIEYFVLRELYLNTGRILGFSMLFLVGIYGTDILKLLLIGLTSVISIVGILSNNLQKALNQEME